MEKLFYSWDEQLKDTNEICALIEKDDFVPDVIVGISLSLIHISEPTRRP